jgi:hypothetical protein
MRSTAIGDAGSAIVRVPQTEVQGSRFSRNQTRNTTALPGSCHRNHHVSLTRQKILAVHEHEQPLCRACHGQPGVPFNNLRTPRAMTVPLPLHGSWAQNTISASALTPKLIAKADTAQGFAQGLSCPPKTHSKATTFCRKHALTALPPPQKPCSRPVPG